MDKPENELEKLESLAQSFTTMGNFTQVMRDSYSKLESQYEDLNSRLARINELLRQSLAERNRLAHYLSNILESVDSGVIVTNQEGTIDVFNSTAERFTGVRAESALGKNYWDILGIGLPRDSLNSILKDSGSHSGEINFNGADGQVIPAAYSITKLRQVEAEDHGGMVIILYNLVEIKKLEDNLKKISTLAALGEMAATVAHEIRNPLAGISGFTALLLRDLEADNSSKRLVEKINEGVISLNAIVASLLDYTRSVSPSISNVDAVSVVKEAITDLGNGDLTPNCIIQIEADSKNLKANLDPQLFRMVVFNLVKNAVQACPDGGKVKLTLKNTKDGKLQLIVEDNGPGIPDDAFGKLFTPFYTTKTNGTGLGLATVKKLTELHGGRVAAENKPEGGARFLIDIPNAFEGAVDET